MTDSAESTDVASSISTSDEEALQDPCHIQDELLRGLRNPQPAVPSKYFYDARGCDLFEQICETPEYYPTRTELGIMEECAGEMADSIGPHVVLIEYGSGASVKTRLLLDALESPAAYLPLDIASDHLQETAAALQRQYPSLQILPIRADFTQPLTLPEDTPQGRHVVYFPGSTIGNLRPDDAVALLQHVTEACPGGGMLLGIDLVKDRHVLEAAYNDSQGVTAEFNSNILAHLNRAADADFNPELFSHRAFFNESRSRMEMHLDAREDMQVSIGAETVEIPAGASIRTELSHKYDLDTFPALAARAGLRLERAWTDPQNWFAVVWLTC